MMHGSVPLSVVTAHPSAFLQGGKQSCSMEQEGNGIVTHRAEQ